jgi:hypothetical protein
MSDDKTAAWYAVSVAAARVQVKIDRQLGRPSPAWIVAMVEEGERREREQREASASSAG